MKKEEYYDFVYNMFDGVGEFIEHIARGIHHIVGYFNGRLIEVTWNKGLGRICFAFVDLAENHHKEDEVGKLIGYIKEHTKEYTTEIWKNGCWVLVDFSIE